mmetsp:Transcript_33558/g.77393  ORF Transcript_33558/g.77393 Transcript_33558/m.77393 type:complete len:409 (+) Transcript_33558:415-1641(+)
MSSLLPASLVRKTPPFVCLHPTMCNTVPKKRRAAPLAFRSSWDIPRSRQERRTGAPRLRARRRRSRRPSDPFREGRGTPRESVPGSGPGRTSHALSSQRKMRSCRKSKYIRYLIIWGIVPLSIQIAPGSIGPQMPPHAPVDVHVGNQMPRKFLQRPRRDLVVLAEVEQQPLHEPLDVKLRHALSGMLPRDDPRLQRPRPYAHVVDLPSVERAPERPHRQPGSRDAAGPADEGEVAVVGVRRKISEMHARPGSRGMVVGPGQDAGGGVVGRRRDASPPVVAAGGGVVAVAGEDRRAGPGAGVGGVAGVRNLVADGAEGGHRGRGRDGGTEGEVLHVGLVLQLRVRVRDDGEGHRRDVIFITVQFGGFVTDISRIEGGGYANSENGFGIAPRGGGHGRKKRKDATVKRST